MANQEYLYILTQGVEIWNKWREEHSDIRPELSEAHLEEAHLNNADLSNANLKEAHLGMAYLNNADLSNANLERADLFLAHLNNADLSNANLEQAHLRGADLIGANLSNADLFEVEFSGANLSNADLSGSDLKEANLTDADLSGANLSQARIIFTVFGAVDLRTVKGLETLKHDASSTVGIDTIYRSHGNIPEVFLKGAGIDDTFITYIRSLVGKPIEYYSCFISYSSKDDAFARRLYADLQSNNVRCWFAPHDLKTGDRYRDRIDESIRLYDKLLLILSKNAVASTWVEEEVEKAMDKERQL